MNVLITGGAGFIGYHLARYHAALGSFVTILDNFQKTDGQSDIEFDCLKGRPNVSAVTVDLTLPFSHIARPKHIDVVYHLAAINGTRLFYEKPYEVARSNLLVTLNLLDWLKDANVGRLVYASTPEVYAGGQTIGTLDVPTNEEVPVVFPQPTDARFSYGTSKFMGEFLCFHFGRVEKLPVSVVRYHNIYGPRMGVKHVIPEFILRWRARENPFRIYGGDETRAFCYVDDAVEATRLVGTSAACDDQIIHVGNPQEEIAIRHLAMLLMEIAGERLEIEECGRRSGSVSRRCPDTTKLRRLTNFQPRVPLREGLSRTLRWYLDHRY